jgi:methylamine dehydrogenase accessory protein MauD
MDWATIGLISYIVLWVVVIVQVVLTVALARLVGQLMSRRFPAGGARVIDPGPETGTLLDGWETTDLFGEPVAVQFPRERGLFALYVSPHCSVCASLLPVAKHFFKEIATEAEGVWVLTLGTRQAQSHYARENGLTQQRVLAEDLLPPIWRLGGGPFGLWISATGEVKAKGMVNSREHLESLHNAAVLGHASFQSYVTAQAEKGRQSLVGSVPVVVTAAVQVSPQDSKEGRHEAVDPMVGSRG